MRQMILFCSCMLSASICLFVTDAPGAGQFAFSTESTDSLPAVLSENHADLIESKLRNEAALRFAQHQLPKTKQEWETHRAHLKDEIIKKSDQTVFTKLNK